MPTVLSDIPLGIPIVDQSGGITIFYRLRWNELQERFQLAPVAATADSPSTDPSAATGTTSLLTTVSSGLYRVTVYSRKTVADGVSSSLQLTLGWTEHAVALTKTFAAVTADSITTSVDSITWTVLADATTDINFSFAYASNTPGNMKYLYRVRVEQLSE